MDYGINSIFKNKCNLQKAKDKKQLVRTAKRVWKEVGILECKRTMLAWPKRVKKMIDALGYQIEHF